MKINIKEVLNKMSLYFVGIWVLARLGEIQEKVYNETIPWWVLVIVGAFWMIYIVTKDFKNE